VDRSLLSAGVFLKTGAMGTFALVDAARRLGTVKKLVLMSTDEVYGSVATGLMSEASPLNPSSPYSAAKAAGDLLALSYARSFRLPVVIPRGCNIYGPRQFPEKAVPVFTINALRDEPLPVYGDGRQEREWMHVADAVRALLLLCRKGKPGEIYNVGTGLWRRNIVVVKRILARLGKPESLIRYVTDRPGHDRRYAIKASKIHALGWKPRVAFGAGLDTTVDWYRDHAAWWKPLRERTRGYLTQQYAARLKTGKRA
jgi:dTDP-glucose 4,6-dehydratase